MLFTEPLDISKEGVTLHIDDESACIRSGDPLFIDCETDERDNFVGIGFTQNGQDIYYQTRLDHALFEACPLIGHNLKADIKWLKSWHADIKAEQIYGDTMLMSYCQDPTREKHGLKSLARSITKLEYPDYKTIVGKGRGKVTLDAQPVETTANYCGYDVLATYRLCQHFNKALTPIQKSLYQELELPLMRLLYQMELGGIRVDIQYLDLLRERFNVDLSNVCSQFGDSLNPNSPVQVKQWLKSQGINVTSTDKKILSSLEQTKPLKDLSEYREVKKLQSTYVEPLLKKQVNEIVYTTFSQLLTTGRLSSYAPNLQNIPTRTDRGDLLRRCFIPRTDHTFIDADYSQIEYRLLAHFTQEPILIQTYQKGGDVHEATASLLGVSRYLGKTLNFASIYGAQPKKIAQTVNSAGEGPITEIEAKAFLDKYWLKLPRVKYWTDKVKDEARRTGSFRTLSGQYYKLKYIYDPDKYKRWFSERQAVNGVIQGSAAYIIKLAMLELVKLGYIPLLQVHDELLFEETGSLDVHMGNIKEVMENVMKLDVPLEVSIGAGKTWQEAKK